MSSSAFQKFTQLTRGRSASSGSFSTYDDNDDEQQKKRNAMELYNSYVRQVDQEEKQRNASQYAPTGRDALASVGRPSDEAMQQTAQAASAERQARAKALPELEKKKSGDISYAPDTVKTAQSHLDALDDVSKKLLETYGRTFYNDGDLKETYQDKEKEKASKRSHGAYQPETVENTYSKAVAQSGNKGTLQNSNAQRMASELMDKNGWDLDQLNDALSDAKTVGKYKYANSTYLTTEEEQTYNKASIEALSSGEQKALSLIQKGQEQNDSDTKYDMWGNGLQSLARGYAQKAMGNDPDYGEGNKSIEEGKAILKNEYGWDDDKIHEYELRSQRLADEAYTKEQEEALDFTDKDDSAVEKAVKGAGSWLYGRAAFIPSMTSVLSNLEEKPEGQGRNMYSTANNYRNIRNTLSSNIQQDYLGSETILDKNPVGEWINNTTGNNVGQFLYGASESVGDSAIAATTGGALMESLGVTGASAKLASALKNGTKVTSTMKKAATVEKIVQNATMTPFMTEGYESAYQSAREQGASEEGAQLRGVAGGIAEYITEKVSLDHAWEIARGTKTGKNIIVNLLAQGVIEGSEEIASDVLNDIADEIISKAQQDKLSDYDQRVSDYVADGMNKDDAVLKVLIEKINEYAVDGVAGILSGLGMGTGTSVQGYQTANYNKKRGEAVSEYYGKQAETTSDTAYGKSAKEKYEQYAKNPTQYYADTIDDSTVEGKEAKQNIQQYANKEASGKKLSASDRLDIEQSLYVAENVSKGQEQYQKYVRELSEVPDSYRSAKSTMTVDEAQKALTEAAGNGDVQKLSDTYQAMKTSTSAEMRSQADDMYSSIYGMAETNGIDRTQLEALKVSPQDAYMEGMKGTTIENLDTLSTEARQAYNEGSKKRIEAGRYVVESSANLKGNVQTDFGSVTLDGTFDLDGKVNTNTGSVSVDDILDGTSVKQAYVNASTQKTINAKNAYIANIKDGVNLHQYDYGFNAFYNAGATGITYDNAVNGGFASVIEGALGKDTTEAIYNAGRADYATQISKEASDSVRQAFGVKKGTGTFTDARASKKADVNTDFMDLVAKATGLNVVLTNKNSKGEQASFNAYTSTIAVTEDHALQLVHELGEFVDTYAGEEYEKIREAAMNTSAQVLGADAYNRTLNNYQRTYEKLNKNQSALDSSREMTNDYLVSLMSTKEGREALTDYMAKNYGEKEAKSLGNKIKDFFDKIVSSLKNMLRNTSLNSYQKKLLDTKITDTKKQAQQFLTALDTAIENYKATEETKGEETVKNSLSVDSEGNALSENQAAFFESSKIRGNDGKLKVMHHGTIAYGFNVFDIKKAKSAGAYGRGFYFSDSNSHAGQYGKTYDVYLNIVDPLTTDTHNITRKQLEAFIKEIANDEDYGIENYGYGATPTSVAKSVWGKDDFAMLQDINATCIGDFAETVKIFNRVNGTTHDGIVTPTETVAFYSNQIKDIKNGSPTSDPDIRFSLKVDPDDYKDISAAIPTKESLKGTDAVEQTKTLIAVHNLNAEQLDGILDLGGLPCPSIAIIKSGMEHSKYGDVSLLFKKETIDPEFMKGNRVYGGDAWTVCFPSIEYKLSEKVLDETKRLIDSLPEQALSFGNAGLDVDNATNMVNRSKGNVAEAFKDIPQLQLAFVMSKDGLGKTSIEYPTRTKNLSSTLSNELIEKLSEALPDGILDDGWSNADFDRYANEVAELANEINWNDFLENRPDSNKPIPKFVKKMRKHHFDNISRQQFDGLLKAVQEYRESDYQFPKETDQHALRDMLSKMVTENEDAYNEWIEKTFSEIVVKEGIRNNRDLFDNNGNRRSWDSLHVEPTLDNIVSIMRSDGEKGAAGFFSTAAFQAIATRDFKSIDDIHAHENQLYSMDEAEREALQEDHSNRFSAICNEIVNKREHNSYIALDNAAECIAEAVQKCKDANGIQKELRKYKQLDIKPDTGKKISKLVEDIASMPTEYFEAKPMRAVRLNEIAKAVVPSTVEQSTIEHLEKLGINYEVYESGNEEARRQALAKTDEVRFSLNVDMEDQLSNAEWRSFYTAVAEYNEGNGNNYYVSYPNGDVIIPLHKNGIYQVDNKVVITDADLQDPQIKKLYCINTDDGDKAAHVISFIEKGALNGEEFKKTERTIEVLYRKGILTRYDFGDRSSDGIQNGRGKRGNLGFRFEDDTELPNGRGSNGSLNQNGDLLGVNSERYSLSIEDDDFFNLFGGTESSGASILEEGMEALKNHAVDTDAVRKIAIKLRNEYGSTINVNTFSDMLNKAFAYMQTDSHTSYGDMMRIMEEIATPVVEQCTETEGEEQYRDFVNALKGYKVKLDDAQLEEVKNTFGSYVNFKKAMSPLNLNKNGVSLDSVWDEMVQASGYALDENTNAADQPLALYDTLSSLRPTPVNQYGGNAEDVARDLAMRIVEEYFGTQSDEKMKKLSAQMRQKNKEYRAKVRERYNDRLAEAKQGMKDKVSEIGQKKAEEIAKLKAKNKQTAQNARERRAVKEEKQKITKRAKTLMKWVSEPTDEHHIPKDMEEPVLSFLNALDFVEPDIKQDKDGNYSVRIFVGSQISNGRRKMLFDTITRSTRSEVLSEYYQRLNSGMGSQDVKSWALRMNQMKSLLEAARDGRDYNNSNLDGVLEMLDPEMADQLSDLMERNNGTASINNLPSSDLHTINNLLRGIIHAVNMKNKAITQNATIEEWAIDTIQTASQYRSKDYSTVRQKIHKNLTLDMMTPETFFTLIGKSGEEIYSSINQGFNRKVKDIKQASDYMKDVLKDVSPKELAKWTGKNAEIRTFQVFDGTIDLTPAHIMSLYELNQRQQATLHYRGGIEVDTMIVKNKGLEVEHTQNQAVHLTDEDLVNIFSTMTDKQKRVADKIQIYMANQCSAQGNEASMLMYGYEKFKDPNYFPISVDKSTTAVQSDGNAKRESLNGIERMGMTKQVNPNASNPIIVKDIFEVLSNHVTDIAAYHGYAPAIKDANRWINFKTKEKINDSYEKHITVQQAVNTSMGRTDNAGVDYYTKLIKDINGSERSGEIQTFWSSLIGNYKAASVGANLRVVIQQPTAFFRAANAISPKYLAKSVSKSLPGVASKNIDRIKEVCPTVWWKTQGYYETSLGKSIEEILTGQSSTLDKITEKSMWLAGKADDITWSALYSAVESEQRDLTKGQNLSDEEFQEKVNERFDRLIAQTQVVDATIQKSQWMRGNTAMNKLQTAFMSEPTKSYNMAMKAMIQDSRAYGNNMLKWKATRKAAIVLAVTNVVNALAQSVIDGIRKKEDDEDYLESVLDNFKTNLVDNMNPFGLVPGLNDVFSAFVDAFKGESSYGSSLGQTMDAAAISSITDSIGTTSRLIQGNSNNTWYGNFMTYAKTLSYITGIPVYNFTRDASGIYNLFAENKLEKKKAKDSDKYESVYSQIEKGKDSEDIQTYVDKAMEQGGTIKDIKSGIKSRLKSDYVDSLETNPDYAEKIKEQAVNGFTAIGLTKSEIEDEIKSWGDPTYGYSSLDKAIQSGEGIEDEIKYLQEDKDDDEIVDHIMDEFSTTIEYNRNRNIESKTEDSVNKALKLIDSSYTYDNVKEKQEREAIEKAEKAEKQEAIASAKQATYDIIDNGNGDYKTAIDNWNEAGSDASSIKSSLTTDYVKPLVKSFVEGDKDAETQLRRIAQVKAYIDQQNGTEIAKKYGGDYYKYEMDKIGELIEKYNNEPW